jgi:hypothetical protein
VGDRLHIERCIQLAKVVNERADAAKHVDLGFRPVSVSHSSWSVAHSHYISPCCLKTTMSTVYSDGDAYVRAVLQQYSTLPEFIPFDSDVYGYSWYLKVGWNAESLPAGVPAAVGTPPSQTSCVRALTTREASTIVTEMPHDRWTSMQNERVPAEYQSPFRCTVCHRVLWNSPVFYTLDGDAVCAECKDQVETEPSVDAPAPDEACKFDCRECKLCDKDIPVDVVSFTSHPQVLQSLDDEMEISDVCCTCAETAQGRDLILEKQLQQARRLPPMSVNEAYHFGPLSDWIPILCPAEHKDDDDSGYMPECCVFVNLCRRDPTFHTALVLVDDHGRLGMFGLTMTLPELVAELETTSIRDFTAREDIISYFG